MKGKKGLYTKYISFIVFAVMLIALVSMSVSAVDQKAMDACNTAGGVWCSNQAGAQETCVNGQATKPTNYGSKICYIKQDENVTIIDPQKKYFDFDKLIIEQNTKLWFVSNQSVDCTPIANGGAGGVSGVPQGCGGQVVNSNGQNNGIKVNGGKGGDTCKAGGNGGGGYYWSSALRGGLPGASVTILANTFSIDGVLSVAGRDGANAPTVTGNEGTCGRAGGAGAGGGGGGVLNLISPQLITSSGTGSGSIDVSGGNGGDGSSGTNEGGDDNDFCGHCTDHGASGGGGGGGAAGFLISTEYAVQLEQNPGKEGLAGNLVKRCSLDVCGAAQSGKSGSSGELSNPNIETNCNDKIDNDGDFLIDMDDPDCYVDQAAEYEWDTSIHSLYNTTSWYNHSALNGNDLSCGDDLSGVCVGSNLNLQGETCSGFSNNQTLCQSAGCTYATSYDEYTLQGGAEDTYGCFANDAPLCYGNDKELSSVQGVVRCENQFGVPNGQSYVYVASRVCQNQSAMCTGIVQDVGCGSELSRTSCDAIAGCSWQSTGVGDEGSITGNGKYACFRSPKGKYNWSDAESFSQLNQYVIKRAESTDFISNGQEWYYCDADGKSTYGDIANKVPEYGTFESTLPAGKYACTDALKAVFPDNNMEMCYEPLSSGQTCLQQYQQGDSGADIFCVGKLNSDGTKTPASFDATDFNNQATGFTAQCIESNCYIKESGTWKLIANSNAYNDKPISFSDLCAKSAENGVALEGCSTANSGYGGGAHQENNDPLSCAADPSLCLGEYIDASSSCEDITKTLGQDYFKKRVCSSGQYCNKGSLVYSTEPGQSSPGYQCCVGAEAYCEDYTENTCLSIGGTTRPTTGGAGDEVTCIGNNVSDNCCIGTWSTPPSQLLHDTSINQSFICYKRQDQNLIQECCPAGDCYNSQNDLNGGGKTNVYSLKGYPLNMLVSFDVYGDPPNITQKKYVGLTSSKPIQITYSYFQIRDFAGFQYIEFDYATNNPATGIFILDDGSKNWTYNLSEQKYKATRKAYDRFNRYRIPLSEATSNGVNISNIQNLWITYPGDNFSSTNAILDNIYLSPGPSNHDTSQTLYCTGDWRTWVSNLDGPTNKGFYSDDPVPMTAKQYKEACSAQDSFGWTGSACCGDDSATGYGEFYADTNGLCWNGTTIRNDQTPNYATGFQSSIGGSMLYYSGKESLCNTPEGAYDNILQSFGDVSENTKFLNSAKAAVEVVKPFTIRGSWMCSQESQWVKLSGVNPVELLSSILYDASQKDSAYTLFCGSASDVSNYVPLSFLKSEGARPPLISMLNSACLLHQGDAQSTTGNVYFGFDVSKQLLFEDFNSSILSAFNPFVESGLDCSGVPDNPDASEFFKPCKINNENITSFVVYYNKPFNMILIGNNVLRGSSSVQNPGALNYVIQIWDDFTGFFEGLFSSQQTDALPDFSTNRKIKDVYISKQGDKLVRGVMESHGGENFAKVDYFKLSESVEFLKDALKLNLSSGSNVTYVAGSYNQTIYVRIPVEEVINWKVLTSILRVNSGLPPYDFGSQ